MADNHSQPRNAKEQISELHAVIDTMASSFATMKGNQSQLNIIVNRLQSDKLQADSSTSNSPPPHDPIATTARHGHKLLFPMYDAMEDPLP
jgi:uncharacterized coiled-coil protein SlyX